MIKPKILNVVDQFAQEIKKSLHQMKNVAIDVSEICKINNTFLSHQMLWESSQMLLLATAKPIAENIHILFGFSLCPHWALEVKTVELLLHIVERYMEQDLSFESCHYA